MSHNGRDSVRSRAGFSLVELVTSIVLIVAVMGSILLMGITTDRAYDTGTADSRIESQVRTTLDRIVEELRTAHRETFLPAPRDGEASSTLTYQRTLGVENGRVALSAPRRLEFEYEPGEIDDGLDNDGDGLVDEGQLVLTENVGEDDERRLVLTRWVPELLEGELPGEEDDNGNGMVDERGFVAEWRGETLILHLTLTIPDADGNAWTRTGRTSVRIRN